MRLSIGPLCLCKDSEYIEITTYADKCHVYLCTKCVGMKYEVYWSRE